MNLDEFIKKYQGKKVWHSGASQCVALARQYVNDILKFPQWATVGSAYQILDIASIKYYTKIRNTLSGVPKKGDIIIWQKSYGGYGHIAIVVSADINGVLSFDQNHTGNLDPCQLVNHNYNLVLGWLRPKISQPKESTMKYVKEKGKATIYLYQVRKSIGEKFPISGSASRLISGMPVEEWKDLSSYKNKITLGEMGKDCKECPPDCKPQLDQCIKDFDEASATAEKKYNDMVTKKDTEITDLKMKALEGLTWDKWWTFLIEKIRGIWVK